MSRRPDDNLFTHRHMSRRPDDNLHRAVTASPGATMMAGSYTVAELGHTVERLEARINTLDDRYPSLSEYRANLDALRVERRTLATQLAEQRRSAAEDIAASTAGLVARIVELEGRNKARAALAGSAITALLVTIVAAGVTKGFGI